MTEDKIPEARELILHAKKIIVFTGAGISKESGVPTFREAGGLWDKFKVEDFATPEAFSRRPREVWEWYRFRRKLAKKVQPNSAHYALAKLETTHSDILLSTQNIDNLHSRAGSKNLVELHGNIMHSYCLKCGYMADESENELPGDIPTCPHENCDGLMRPNVVWFGEQLIPEDLERSFQFASESDCCLVVGTSGQVYPAAQIPYLAKRNGARIIEVNTEPSAITPIVDYFLKGQAGDLLPRLV